MRIHWPPEDIEDPQNDLCTVVNGKYVDVVQGYNGTWWPMHGNKHIYEVVGNNGFTTREAAAKYLEEFLSKQ